MNWCLGRGLWCPHEVLTEPRNGAKVTRQVSKKTVMLWAPTGFLLCDAKSCLAFFTYWLMSLCIVLSILFLSSSCLLSIGEEICVERIKTL